jgi:hypothetical protein
MITKPPCPHRPHRGVEREKIGLKGDRPDHANDFCDLESAGPDAAHRRHGVVEHAAPLLSAGLRVARAGGGIGGQGRVG